MNNGSLGIDKLSQTLNSSNLILLRGKSFLKKKTNGKAFYFV